jgi:hypothetical protein
MKYLADMLLQLAERRFTAAFLYPHDVIRTISAAVT